ncbi:2-hydroxyacid dehydrogenase [Clostridium estertheticum]|uniref:2-hydroxyacid dehydrogenase n=1 Tax=Clostridium estertheticum TaxID=238834 RepID=UPI0027E25DC0|nr:D-glycerate dehydrogenase [Clostridium estertheticum]
MENIIKPKVYIAKKISKEAEDYIGEFCDYDKWDSDKRITRTELLNKLGDKEGVLLSGIKIDEELLHHASKLRVVSDASVGYDNFDLKVMKEKNIIGTNTPSVLDNTVADLIFGLMLSTARRISELDNYVKDGRWTAEDDKNLFGVNVHHTTLGIIGMGRIGEVVAKRGKLGFDMDVIYNNRNRKPEIEENLGVKYCDFDLLLQKSDFIVLMTPLTKDTYHLIDFAEFKMMKESAIFINASRGETINEQALIEALQNKKIFGAGLDVYEKGIVGSKSLLLKMSNVVTLPHIGSAVEETRNDMSMLAAKNLVQALLGETPVNLVSELK